MMAKFLEPRYLVYAIVASVIAVIALQATGVGEAIEADPPLECLEADRSPDRTQDRVPIAITPRASDGETRWR
jgi:hypothetical protein